MPWVSKGALGEYSILVWEALECSCSSVCSGQMQREGWRTCLSSKVKLQKFKPAVLGARARWGAAERQSLPPWRFWEAAGAPCPAVGQTRFAKRCRKHWGCVSYHSGLNFQEGEKHHLLTFMVGTHQAATSCSPGACPDLGQLLGGSFSCRYPGPGRSC